MGARNAGSAILAALVALSAGCHPSSHARSPTSSEARSRPSVKVVEGSIVFTNCPDSKHLGARRAEATINKLVDGCTSVPGGTTRFMATLKPGGAIVIAAPSGSRDEGVVPICVLKHRLRHHLWLRHACTMAVQIEEQRVGESH